MVSPVPTFPIARNVASTAPSEIVAVTTPVVALAMVSRFAAEIAFVIVTAAFAAIASADVTVAALVPIDAAASVIVVTFVAVKYPPWH